MVLMEIILQGELAVLGRIPSSHLCLLSLSLLLDFFFNMFMIVGSIPYAVIDNFWSVCHKINLIEC